MPKSLNTPKKGSDATASSLGVPTQSSKEHTSGSLWHRFPESWQFITQVNTSQSSRMVQSWSLVIAKTREILEITSLRSMTFAVSMSSPSSPALFLRCSLQGLEQQRRESVPTFLRPPTQATLDICGSSDYGSTKLLPLRNEQQDTAQTTSTSSQPKSMITSSSWMPIQNTLNALRCYLRNSGGCTLKETGTSSKANTLQSGEEISMWLSRLLYQSIGSDISALIMAIVPQVPSIGLLLNPRTGKSMSIVNCIKPS